VESGSDEILQKINKKISVEEILEATAMAKKYGIAVRFYMMLGNRGETHETFRQTLEFLERAKPHQYLFSCLSVYPGTTDFHDAEAAGWLDREAYFREKFQELKVPFDADEALTETMNRWFAQNKGVRSVYQQSVSDALAVLENLGSDHHAAHMDVAGACFRAGSLDEAKKHIEKALALGYPVPGLAYNYLACIAEREGNLSEMQQHFLTAAKLDPQHAVLIENVQAARHWFAAQGPAKGTQLRLKAQHDFQLFEKTLQPALPGPLPEDYATWPPSAVASKRNADGAKHLRVVH
jgi:tetratricopeptide (TPR) repeat protein